MPRATRASPFNSLKAAMSRRPRPWDLFPDIFSLAWDFTPGTARPSATLSLGEELSFGLCERFPFVAEMVGKNARGLRRALCLRRCIHTSGPLRESFHTLTAA